MASGVHNKFALCIRTLKEHYTFTSTFQCRYPPAWQHTCRLIPCGSQDEFKLLQKVFFQGKCLEEVSAKRATYVRTYVFMYVTFQSVALSAVFDTCAARRVPVPCVARAPVGLPGNARGCLSKSHTRVHVHTCAYM
jgi:hypothetical protein